MTVPQPPGTNPQVMPWWEEGAVKAEPSVLNSTGLDVKHSYQDI